METFKNIISSLNERIRSPFYGTFLVCWLIINWQIIFITFGESYTTGQKIDLINIQLHKYWLSIGWPIIIAVVFFLFYRWIEVLASIYQTWQKRIREDNEMKLMGKHTVSGSRYLELTQKAEDYNKKYVEMRGAKTSIESDLIKQRDENIKLLDDIKKLNQNLSDNPQYADKKNLLGDWVVRVMGTANTWKDDGFDLRIVQNPNNIEFQRINEKGNTPLGFMLCYENNLENVGFALHSSDKKVFINGVFLVMNKDESGKFNYLKGWLESNNSEYNQPEVHLYRKSYYSHLPSLYTTEKTVDMFTNSL